MSRVSASAVYQRIVEDLTRFWGMMAKPMLQKLLKKLGSGENSLTRDDLLRLVDLLEKERLVQVLGLGAVSGQTAKYREWIMKEA